MDLVITFLVWIAAGVVAIFTIVPMLPLRHGFFRGGDFTRPQIFWIAIIAIAAMGIWRPAYWPYGAGVLLLCAAIQFGYVARYHRGWPPQALRPRRDDDCRAENRVTILNANVKLSNRRFNPLIAQVRGVQPDVFVALETDQGWIDALDALTDLLPHRFVRPNDNGYGMAIYTHLPLEQTHFENRVVDNVPAFEARATLPSGRSFRLHVLHPEPPDPAETTRGRDADLVACGFRVRDDDLPALVVGDLNDVPWSSNIRSFQRMTGLLDPRVGRGFYNSFSALHPWMRWPLDHIFLDPHFRLLKQRRMPKIGSDHFPMLWTVCLTETPRWAGRPSALRPGEEEELRQMKEIERASDRNAIGEDWEKPGEPDDRE